MYCTVDDMTDTFGVKEITMLAQSLANDRVNDLTDPDIRLKVEKAIEDACQEINMELACCFDMKAVFKVYTDGGTIPGLGHICKDIARYHLYTCIWLGTENNGKDHEAFRRYEDALSHLRRICDCRVLIDNTGCQISNAARPNIAVACRPDLGIDNICCLCRKTPCGCKGG